MTQSAREVSPLLWPVPRGTRSTPWSAASKSSEFLRQSRVVAEAWGKGGVETRYEESPARTISP